MIHSELHRTEMLGRLTDRPLAPAVGAFTMAGRPNTDMGSQVLVDLPTYRAYWIYNHGGTILAATHGPHNAAGHRVEVRGVGNHIDDCRWAAEQHSGTVVERGSA